MITTEGEVSQYLKLDHILKRTKSFHATEKQREDKEADLQSIKDFIKDNRPHCIVIGAADRVTMSIKFDLEVVLKELVEQEQFPKIKVCSKKSLSKTNIWYVFLVQFSKLNSVIH